MRKLTDLVPKSCGSAVASDAFESTPTQTFEAFSTNRRESVNVF